MKAWETVRKLAEQPSAKYRHVESDGSYSEISREGIFLTNRIFSNKGIKSSEAKIMLFTNFLSSKKYDEVEAWKIIEYLAMSQTKKFILVCPDKNYQELSRTNSSAHLTSRIFDEKGALLSEMKIMLFIDYWEYEITTGPCMIGTTVIEDVTWEIINDN